jgi:hypothetical protein
MTSTGVVPEKRAGIRRHFARGRIVARVGGDPRGQRAAARDS